MKSFPLLPLSGLNAGETLCIERLFLVYAAFYFGNYNDFKDFLHFFLLRHGPKRGHGSMHL